MENFELIKISVLMFYINKMIVTEQREEKIFYGEREHSIIKQVFIDKNFYHKFTSDVKCYHKQLRKIIYE